MAAKSSNNDKESDVTTTDDNKESDVTTSNYFQESDVTTSIQRRRGVALIFQPLYLPTTIFVYQYVEHLYTALASAIFIYNSSQMI